MTAGSRTLSLIVQNVVPVDGLSCERVLRSALQQVTKSLLASALWAWPIQFATKGRKQASHVLESTERLIADAVQRSAEGVTLTGPRGHEATVDLASRPEDFDLYCTLALDESPANDLLGCLTTLAVELWGSVRSSALIGPVFSIRSFGVDYARPLPPRHSVVWHLGDAAYFICEGFHHTSAAADSEAAKLITAPIPASLERYTINGLTVIRCRGPAEESNTFARQRFELEVWISSVLNLPLNPEFNELGDQRLGILRREPKGAFTFVDRLRGIGFKAVAEPDARTLDTQTRQELAEFLAQARADAPKMRNIMIVFPTRDAATHNNDVVTRLGATGAVYVGDDNHVWNPTPPGNWVRTHWGMIK